MSKLLSVFGATGQQGGSLIEYCLGHPELSKIYRLRAITRDVSKPAAQKLKGKGVEVVAADLNNPASLALAVDGAYAVFAVRNFWDTSDPTIEITQGKALALAALKAGVTLYIWSSLPNVTKMTAGKLTTIQNFDTKANVEEFVRELGFRNSVFIMPGWYMQNVISPVTPRPGADGNIILPLAWPAETRVPLFDLSDIGKYLAPVLRNPSAYHGKRLTAATAFYTAKEMVDIWSRVSGKPVRLATPEEIPTVTDTLIQRLIATPNPLFTEWAYFGPTGPEDLQWTLSQVDSKLTTWEEFVTREGPRFRF